MTNRHLVLCDFSICGALEKHLLTWKIWWLLHHSYGYCGILASVITVAQ